MWKQTKVPNLDPIIYQGNVILYNWLGWCLAYVQTAFGAGWSGSTAWDGWTVRTAGKHTDRNMPAGVYVPIWFDGYWNGQRLGHVAIYKDGVVWSSPYTNKPYADKLGSIADVERIYGMKFVGWSEFVGSTRVLEWVEVTPKVTLAQLTALYKEILERGVDQSGINSYVGKATYDYVRNELLKSPERNDLLKRKEAERKAAEAAAAAEAARKAQAEKDRVLAEQRAAAEAEAKRQKALEDERLAAEKAAAEKAELERLAAEKAAAEAAAKNDGYTQTDRDRDNNIAVIVKAIWDFITSIFKSTK